MSKIIDNKKKKQKEEEQPISIMGATLVDGFCNYEVEIIKGTGVGTHGVKGAGLFKDDLADAFADLNVHLACIDEVFKHSGKEFKDINKMIPDELTGLYRVVSFKIKGKKNNEYVILMGTKYVTSSGGYMEIKTPKIGLDKLSSYKWWNELKQCTDTARKEVELYMGGKFTPVEEEEGKTNPNQLSILDGENGKGEITDADFKLAKVK